MGLLNFIRRWSVRKMEKESSELLKTLHRATDDEIAVFLGWATHLRLTMDESGDLPKSLFEIVNSPVECQPWQYQVKLSLKVNQRFAQTKNKAEYVGGVILLSTLRAIINFELRPLAFAIWKELKRGQNSSGKTAIFANSMMHNISLHPDIIEECDYVPPFILREVRDKQLIR